MNACINMESRKMVPKNLFAGQQWRSRNREQTYGHGERRGEERVRCMERVAWELTLPYIKYAQKNESFCKATLFWTSFPFRPPQCMKQFPVLCSKFPLVIYFLHRTNSVCVKPNPPTPPTPSPLGIHTLVPFVCVSISEKSPVLKTWGSGE